MAIADARQCRRLVAAAVVAVLATLPSLSAGADSARTHTPTLMIKANDLAELPPGLGTWSIVGCGITARDGWTLPPLANHNATGPCAKGQDEIFTSYASFKAAVTAGQVTPGETVIFDPEKWLYTPHYETLNQAKYEALAGKLASARSIKLVFTPQGSPGPSLDAQYQVAAHYATLIEIQSQAYQGNPTAFKNQVLHDISVVRAINKSVPILAGMASDPNGTPAVVTQMVASYDAVAAHVAGFQLNLARWRAPTGTGCAPSGCASIGVAFLHAVGVN